MLYDGETEKLIKRYEGIGLMLASSMKVYNVQNYSSVYLFCYMMVKRFVNTFFFRISLLYYYFRIFKRAYCVAVSVYTWSDMIVFFILHQIRACRCSLGLTFPMRFLSYRFYHKYTEL